MTPEKSAPYNPYTLCNEFAHRHNILATQLVRREFLAIYWTSRTNLEIDTELSTLAEELNHSDPLWGTLRSMLDRTFEYVEGAIVAYATGATSSSEIISRTAIESAINLMFILIDKRNGNHLSQYLAQYFDNEQREIDQWLITASDLAGDAQKVHQLAATKKQMQINKLQQAMDIYLSQIGLPPTKALTTKWPRISERF
jgi:hypothetical protein